MNALLLLALTISSTPHAHDATPPSPAPEPSPLEVAWIFHEGERALFVLAEDAATLITGLDLDAGDRAQATQTDLDGDGRMDVSIHVQEPDRKRVHHVRMSSDVPPVLSLSGGGGDQTIVDLVGDLDNFGFGAGQVPCAFFDNSGPGDLEIFDAEPTSESEIDVWTHDLSEFDIDEAPSLVVATLEIRETFSDPGEDSTLIVELSQDISFEAAGSDCSGGCVCDFGTVQTFTTTTSDAAFLRDFAVVVQFYENEDDIGLDYSMLTLDLTF